MALTTFMTTMFDPCLNHTGNQIFARKKQPPGSGEGVHQLSVYPNLHPVVGVEGQLVKSGFLD